MAKKKHEIAVRKEEETGEVVITTEELKKKAIENCEKIRQAKRKAIEGHIDLGILLKENRDEKLYRHLGYDSFQQYVEFEHNISRRYAYNHIEIIEKLPPQFVQCIAQMNVNIYRLTQIITLPDKVLEKANEDQLKEWAELPFKDFNEEMRKTKARYQKMRRDKIRTDEKNLTLEAEKKELLKETKELTKEISILKTTEKNKKILELQQSRENLRERIKELEFIQEARESKELKEELALAAIDEAQANITSAFVELRRIELCPAILPRLLNFYKYARDILDTQITLLMDKFDPNSGPLDLECLAKEMKRKPRIDSSSQSKNNESQKKETE